MGKQKAGSSPRIGIDHELEDIPSHASPHVASAPNLPYLSMRGSYDRAETKLAFGTTDVIEAYHALKVAVAEERRERRKPKEGA